MITRQALRSPLVVIASVVTAFLVSCFYDDPAQLGVVAFREDENGEIVLLIRSCDPTANVQAIELTESTGQSGVSGPLLWAIKRADASPAPETFTLGEEAGGFEETTRLGDFLDSSQRYLVDVKFEDPALALRNGFIPEELEGERWFAAGELLTESEFNELELDCD